MSPLTIFLAKLLGLYCIILALAMMQAPSQPSQRSSETRRFSYLWKCLALLVGSP